MSNAVLTGLPRSGTTLTCYLLQKLPEVVALHEPLEVKLLLAASSHAAACREIERSFSSIRRRIIDEGTAPAKVTGAAVPDNPFSGERNESGLRVRRAKRGLLRIEKPLSDDFLLVIKETAPFTALLDILARSFPCYAIVRNPLAILSSWNSVSLSAAQGRSRAAAALSPELADDLNRLHDKTDRQLRLLDWYFEQYLRLLPQERIVSYERIVATSGRALAVIAPAAAELADQLSSQNASPLYDRNDVTTLAGRLLEDRRSWSDLYPPETIEALAAEMTGG